MVSICKDHICLSTTTFQMKAYRGIISFIVAIPNLWVSQVVFFLYTICSSTVNIFEMWKPKSTQGVTRTMILCLPLQYYFLQWVIFSVFSRPGQIIKPMFLLDHVFIKPQFLSDNDNTSYISAYVELQPQTAVSHCAILQNTYRFHICFEKGCKLNWKWIVLGVKKTWEDFNYMNNHKILKVSHKTSIKKGSNQAWWKNMWMLNSFMTTKKPKPKPTQRNTV